MNVCVVDDAGGLEGEAIGQEEASAGACVEACGGKGAVDADGLCIGHSG